jgi:hypothetical protein
LYDHAPDHNSRSSHSSHGTVSPRENPGDVEFRVADLRTALTAYGTTTTTLPSLGAEAPAFAAAAPLKLTAVLRTAWSDASSRTEEPR